MTFHIIPLYLHHTLLRRASHKVITTSTRMRNHTRQFIVSVENHPIRSGRATSINIVVAHDRILVVGAANREIEAFIVVVLMRVVVNSISRLVKRVPLGLGCADIARPVAGASAGILAAFAAFEVIPGGGRGKRRGEEEGEKGDDALIGIPSLVP